MDRLFAALLAVGLICGLFGLSQLGAFDSFDRAAREMRFSLLDRSPSGDIVFIDIDSSSLAAVGIWPWPRGLYAEALDRLMELGADAVAFDIDFSSLSSPKEDEKFRAALERAGGYAILGAFFQQAHGSVEPVPTLPQPVFAAVADPVLR